MTNESLKSVLNVLRKEIPSLKEEDLETLSNIVGEISLNRDQELNEEGTAIHPDWVPTPMAVKETLGIGVRLIDLEYCIRSFTEFALEKRYIDNLSAKFITHVKIMAQQSKISLITENQ